MDAAGNLYGQLAAGPFELSPSPRGWTEEIISPYVRNSRSGLTMGAAGNIYGTTIQGGANDMGTVFELTPVGKGKYQEKVLWSFNGKDGSGPQSSLILDGAGNLYGMTPTGGLDGNGVVFEVTP
jgi:uncharacterized repeat protein (TIGR03803 family)